MNEKKSSKSERRIANTYRMLVDLVKCSGGVAGTEDKCKTEDSAKGVYAHDPVLVSMLTFCNRWERRSRIE